MNRLVQLAVFLTLLYHVESWKTVRYWTEKLSMTQPFGDTSGWLSDIYKSDETYDNLPERYGMNATRHFAEHIYFLLESDIVTPFYRLKSDELRHHYYGATCRIYTIEKQTGRLTHQDIGPAAKSFVVPLKRGDWHAITVKKPAPGRYCLLGITVIPGWNLEDFYKPTTDDLVELYPKLESKIRAINSRYKGGGSNGNAEFDKDFKYDP
uniref:uncharacterized protein LOC120346519 n=1 Tax=Styela clava TaxID=7725 RepID=UPI0019394D0F|nr:uncharacterized protein LOC120346519 [Styela clava]